MKIQAIHLGNLLAYAQYKGLKEDDLRAGLSNPLVDVCSEENYISSSDYLKVFNMLCLYSNSHFCGLHYGFFLNIKSLGFIATLSQQAINIEQAVLILQDYLKYSFPLISLNAINEDNKYILNIKYIGGVKALKSQIIDAVFCFVYREIKLMLPHDVFVYLEHPKGTNNEYIKFFNQDIIVGKNYSIFFDATVLNKLINKKTLKEIDILLPKFLKMLNKKGKVYKGFSARVRDITLNMCQPELPTFDKVCAQFNTSNRTVQRRLAEEGITFRKIADDIRKELHVYLTAGKKMKTQDIAYILGYSEPSAYLHAVKRWKASL